MTIIQFGISITVGVMACLLTSSCGSGEQPKTEDKAEYQTMVVGRKDMTLTRQ